MLKQNYLTWLKKYQEGDKNIEGVNVTPTQELYFSDKKSTPITDFELFIFNDNQVHLKLNSLSEYPYFRIVIKNQQLILHIPHDDPQHEQLMGFGFSDFTLNCNKELLFYCKLNNSVETIIWGKDSNLTLIDQIIDEDIDNTTVTPIKKFFDSFVNTIYKNNELSSKLSQEVSLNE